jgi:hypothetical protein
MIPANQRLEINALIEDLMGDTNIFPAASARRLIDLVPITKREWVQIDGEFSAPGRKATGYSPGVGTVLGGGEDEKKSFSAGDRRLRVGGWQIAHRTGRLDVNLMWGETTARLVYDRRTHAPERLLITEERALRLGALTLRRFVFVPWKTPAE